MAVEGLWIWGLGIFLFAMATGVGVASFYIGRRLALPKVRTVEQAKNIELERTPDLFDEYRTWEKQSFWLPGPNGYEIRCHYVAHPGNEDQPYRKMVVVAHGFRHTHYGGIKYASLFRSLGYDVLLFDQRRHGETGGKNTTLGFREHQDVRAIVDHCFLRFGPRLQLGLVGESMGAATVLLAASGDPRLRFVVADCPFAELRTLAIHQIHTLHKLPTKPFVGLSSLFFHLFTGAFYRDVSPLRAVSGLFAPTLFVHGTADRTIPYLETVRLHEACVSPKRMVLYEGTKHAESFRKHRSAYKTMIESFLHDLVSIQTLDYDYTKDQEAPNHV